MIALVAAGSSILATLLTQAIIAWRDRRTTNRDAAFSALYLAIALEAYGNECASLISDSENYEASDGAAGNARGNLAELPAYPGAIDWKAFGIHRTTRAMSFRTEIDSLRAMLNEHWEHVDDDEIAPLVREQAAKVGDKALELAAELRRHWRIEPVTNTGDWDVHAFLKTKRASYEDKRKRWEAMRLESDPEMMGGSDIPEPPQPEIAADEQP